MDDRWFRLGDHCRYLALKMKLETAGSLSANPATPDDIRMAVANDKERAEFLILSRSRECFVQAAGDTEPFFVEYYDDENELPQQCNSHLSADELTKLLLRYLANDDDWHNEYDWTLEPKAPWWKFW